MPQRGCPTFGRTCPGPELRKRWIPAPRRGLARAVPLLRSSSLPLRPSQWMKPPARDPRRSRRARVKPAPRSPRHLPTAAVVSPEVPSATGCHRRAHQSMLTEGSGLRVEELVPAAATAQQAALAEQGRPLQVILAAPRPRARRAAPGRGVSADRAARSPVPAAQAPGASSLAGHWPVEGRARGSRSLPPPIARA